MAEKQRCNKTTIKSLTDEQKRELLEIDRMCEAFQQHFPRLYKTRGAPDAEWTKVPTCIACHDSRQERTITAADIWNVMARCAGSKSHGFESLRSELYCHMPYLYGGDLAAVYSN